MKSRIKYRWTTIWLGLLPLLGTAEPIIFPSGLRIDPPADVDVTYQVVPSYDDKEKVIAVWEGEKLQFFITQRHSAALSGKGDRFIFVRSRSPELAASGLA